MQKAVLRSIYKAKRSALTPTEIQTMSADMIHWWKVLLQGLTVLNRVMSYRPINGKVEVDTAPFEAAILNLHPRCKISYPRIEGEGMVAVYNEAAAYARHVLGMEEPVSGVIMENASIDMVIVPLLCFDNRGYRVGYGKGYYDRFIPSLNMDCIKVGLSYFEAIADPIFIDQYDKQLDYCITPTGIQIF